MASGFIMMKKESYKKIQVFLLDIFTVLARNIMKMEIRKQHPTIISAIKQENGQHGMKPEKLLRKKTLIQLK